MKKFRGIWPLLTCFLGMGLSFLSVIIIPIEISFIGAVLFFIIAVFLFCYIGKYDKYPWE
jgi:hypothetical protein